MSRQGALHGTGLITWVRHEHSDPVEGLKMATSGTGGQTMKRAVHGIYAAVISPFTSGLNLDARKLGDHCRFLVEDGGCDGVAPAGTTGEGTSMEFSDRMLIPQVLEKAGLPPERVILGIGTPSTGDTVRLAQAAIEHGYGNLLVLPPFYYKGLDNEAVYNCFARLADALPHDDLRIYLYHFPQMSAVPVSVSVVLRLREQFGDRIAGLKDSSGEFSQSLDFVTATGGKDAGFDVFPSSESFLPDALEAGCAGIISASTNYQARQVQAALLSGQPEGSEFYEQVASARRHIQKFPLVAAMKTCQAARSGDRGWLRTLPPNRPLDAREEQDLLSGLARIYPEAGN